MGEDLTMGTDCKKKAPKEYKYNETTRIVGKTLRERVVSQLSCLPTSQMRAVLALLVLFLAGTAALAGTVRWNC